MGNIEPATDDQVAEWKDFRQNWHSGRLPPNKLEQWAERVDMLIARIEQDRLVIETLRGRPQQKPRPQPVKEEPDPSRLPENAWYRIQLPSGKFTIKGKRPTGHPVGHTWRNKFAFLQHLENIGWVWDHNPQEARGPRHVCSARSCVTYDPHRVFHYYEGATVIACEAPIVPTNLPSWKRDQLRHVKPPFHEIGRQGFQEFLAAEMGTLKEIAR